MPGFHAGVIEVGAELLGTKNLRIAQSEAEAPAFRLRITWDA
jgi:hypothetical protein